MSDENQYLRELVADVAAAYFSNTHVTPSEIPSVIGQIAAGLSAVSVGPAAAEAPTEEEPAPVKLTAAQIRKSITPDAIISFEDGKGYKTLKRHLSTRGLSPAEYLAKWGLPADYPLTSPNYSAARSALAKNFGLGQRGRGTSASSRKA